MKNLPVKLLYPALAAAALLSAAGGLAHAAYNNYLECRCKQPSPQAPYNSLTYCCADPDGKYPVDYPADCPTKTPCASVSCPAGQMQNGQQYKETTGTCCVNKTPCSNFWTTTTVGKITTFGCKFPYPTNGTQNSKCAYQEDGCECCTSSASVCANGLISSAASVCTEYGSSSTACICANGNAKTCAAAIYGATADETLCINSGYKSGYCNCTNFTTYWFGVRPNFQDYACIGAPARCTSSGTN